MRTKILSLLATILIAPGEWGGAKASTGTQFKFDPRNLNHAVVMVDIIEACNHKKECRVEVAPGFAVTIRSTTDSMVSFPRRDDYIASGLGSQNVADAELPANPCL